MATKAPSDNLLVVDLPPALLADVQSVRTRGKWLIHSGIATLAVVGAVEIFASVGLGHRDEVPPLVEPAPNSSASAMVDQAPILQGAGVCTSGSGAVSGEPSCTVMAMPNQTGRSGTAALVAGDDAPGEDGSAPTTIMSGRMVAATSMAVGMAGRENPFPAVVRIKTEMFHSNLRNLDLKECHISMSGYGDVSSERVILRTEKIICNDHSGRDFEGKVSGYAVGEDGRVGIRGNLVTKKGQLIANALLAGVADGIGQAVNSQSTRSLSPTTGIATVQPTYVQSTSSNSGRTAAGGSLSGAFQALARWYVQQADSIFPVVEIGAGRLIDIVITSPILLTEVDGNAAGSEVQTSRGENDAFNGGHAGPAPDDAHVSASIQVPLWVRILEACGLALPGMLATCGALMQRRGGRLAAIAASVTPPKTRSRKTPTSQPLGSDEVRSSSDA